MKRNPFVVDPQDMVQTLLALAAEAKRPLRLSVKERERRRERERQRRKRLAVEARLRVSARRVPRPVNRPCLGRRMVDRMAEAMESGRWYGAKDIARLAGLPNAASSAGKVIQALYPSGLVERKLNPLWDQHAVVPPREIMAGAVREPKWLYRLTARGELHCEALALLGD